MRGSRDGFRAEDFHEFCDKEGPTLTLVRSDCNQVVGGYTSESWSSPTISIHKKDENAFIFNLTDEVYFKLPEGLHDSCFYGCPNCRSTHLKCATKHTHEKLACFGQ
jgi:hypothetical protein